MAAKQEETWYWQQQLIGFSYNDIQKPETSVGGGNENERGWLDTAARFQDNFEKSSSLEGGVISKNGVSMGWQGSAEKEKEMVSGKKGVIVSSVRELEAQFKKWWL